MEVTFYGHITIDEIDGETMIGGPPNYGGVVIADYFGIRPLVITSCAATDVTRFVKETKDKLQYIVELSKETTVFRFPKLGHENKMELLSKASNLRVIIPTDLAILNPVCREVSNNFINEVRSISKYLAIDIQGLVRTGELGEIKRTNFLKEYHYIKSANLIKVSNYELPFLIEGENLEELQKMLSSMEVLVSKGHEGAVLIYNETKYEVSSPSVTLVNSTGAGDVLISMYAYLRAKNESIETSLAYAVAAASSSISHDGVPHSMPKDQIDNIAHNLLSRINKSTIRNIIEDLKNYYPKNWETFFEQKNSDVNQKTMSTNNEKTNEQTQTTQDISNELNDLDPSNKEKEGISPD